jgi:hypothetical protein
LPTPTKPNSYLDTIIETLTGKIALEIGAGLTHRLDKRDDYRDFLLKLLAADHRHPLTVGYCFSCNAGTHPVKPAAGNQFAVSNRCPVLGRSDTRQ